jgi:hypothetical protein
MQRVGVTFAVVIMATVVLVLLMPFAPAGLWPLLPFLFWGSRESREMIRRRQFTRQARRELKLITGGLTHVG